MADIFKYLFELGVSIHPAYYLAIVIFLQVLENLFPPVPGDTFLIYVTWIFFLQGHSVLPLYVLTTLGSIGGFMLIWWIGKHWGRHFFWERNFTWMPVIFLEKMEKKFQSYGLWVIFFNRFMPGMRAVIGLISGISSIPWKWTLILVTFSTLAWNGLLVSLGYFLGENWEKIEEILATYNRTALSIMALFVIFWLIRRLSTLKTIKKGS